MRLINVSATNFGSFKSIELDLTDLGLALVYGPTGSGKSTLMDLVPWCLFGVSARGAAADDIRSWQTPNEPTVGMLSLSLPTGDITIIRTRGTGKNDLYWTEDDTSDKKERGKDLLDTQKRIEERIGCDYALYSSGSYIGEFSSTGTFFTAPAKARRELFEKLANLDFPNSLADKISLARKAESKLVDSTQLSLRQAIGHLGALGISVSGIREESTRWNLAQGELIKSLETKAENFADELDIKRCHLLKQFIRHQKQAEAEQAEAEGKLRDLFSKTQIPDGFQHTITDLKDQIRSLGTETCEHCGATAESSKRARLQEQLTEAIQARDRNDRIREEIASTQTRYKKLMATTNPYADSLERFSEENHYKARLEQEERRVNPFRPQLAKLLASLAESQDGAALLEARLAAHTERMTSLLTLADLTADLRGELLKRAVARIEERANHHLTTHFDAEIRAAFSIKGSDDLEVGIQKNGYECSFKQLSKGQRCLLKLCFSVAVQEASADSAGIHFANLYFDEALDGLDYELKTKAYGLLKELSTKHRSVLVVEHFPEFQQLFDKRYRVELVGDNSELYAE